MLHLAFVFLIIALIAGALGLFRVEAVAADIAWFFFAVFVLFFVVALVAGLWVVSP